MTDDEQLAGSVKYSSALVWHIAEPRPGLFVLYDHTRSTALITDDWSAVLEAYRARPPYVGPAPRVANNLRGIDLSKLEINL